MSRRFDCIVVGAGPAGLTAALVLARSGVEVLVVERGRVPGSKNMFGGSFSCRGLPEIVPGLWEEAPLERPVTRWVLTFLGPESSFSLDLKRSVSGQPDHGASTVLRSRFDSWYSRKAEEAGSSVLPDTLVEDVLREDGRVVGIRASRDRGELLADVVIAADGVNSLLARKAGLRGDIDPQDTLLGVKEILDVPRELLERNLSLGHDQGMAATFVGAAPAGVQGGGFVYTNRESLSVGFVVRLSSLGRAGKRPEEVLEEFKGHPAVRPLLRETLFREYAAHLIPEGSPLDRGALLTDGLLVVGDAARLALSTGLRHDGVNHAILSGLAAAEAVKLARGKRDFSRAGLKSYPAFLKQFGVAASLRRHCRTSRFLRQDRLYQEYPDLACELAGALLQADPLSMQGLLATAKKSARGKLPWSRLIRDTFQAWRAFG